MGPGEQHGLDRTPGDRQGIRRVSAERDLPPIGDELRRELEAHTEAEARFRLVFEEAPIGIALVAPDGSWLRANDALCRMLGRTHEELVGSGFQELTHPDDLDLDLDFVSQVLAGEIESYTIEKRYLHASGEVVWALLSVSLVRHLDGTPNHFISHVQDITERKHAELDLVRASRLDGLTGVANRRRVEERLEAALEADEDVTVLFVDVDHLKVVNDRLGHLAGDQLLRLVARRLEAKVGSSGLVARWGGDEFVVVLDEPLDVDDLRTAVERPVRVGGFVLRPQMSVGTAVGVRGARSAGVVVGRADADMYRDKRRRAAGPAGPLAPEPPGSTTPGADRFEAVVEDVAGPGGVASPD